jgi:hypothetical protein
MNREYFVSNIHKNVIYATLNNCIFAHFLCNINDAQYAIMLNGLISICSIILSQIVEEPKLEKIFSIMQSICCCAFYNIFVIATYFATLYVELNGIINHRLIKTILVSSFSNLYLAIMITDVNYAIMAIVSTVKAIFKLVIEPPLFVWYFNENKHTFTNFSYIQRFNVILFVVAFYQCVMLSVLCLFCSEIEINFILKLHATIFLLSFGLAFHKYCALLDCDSDALLGYMTKNYIATIFGFISGIACAFICSYYVKDDVYYDVLRLLTASITYVPLFVVSSFIAYLLRPSFKKTYQFETIYPKNETCAICFSTDCKKFVKMHNCRHVFHPACIKQWIIRGNYSCVYCQKDVRKIE